MKTKKLFTEHELAILKVLWGAKEPLARPQILSRLTEPEMNPASFHVAMNHLMEKGYVEVAGFERCGTGYGRTYAAQKTREEFVLHMLRVTQPEGTAPKNTSELMVAFVENTPLDETTISELESLLAERRKSIQAKEADGKGIRKE